jgi:hypothetical protein
MVSYLMLRLTFSQQDRAPFQQGSQYYAVQVGLSYIRAP